MEGLAGCREMLDVSTAEAAPRGIETAHRVMEAPETKGMPTMVHGGLVQRLEANRALEIVQG